MPFTGKIKMNHAGVRTILRSDEVENELRRRAAAIAERAGEGFAYSSTRGNKRALAMVWADTPAARRAEAGARVLTKAIDAGRA